MLKDGHLYFANSRVEGGKMEPRIQRAIRLMTTDLRNDIQLDELAQSLNLSASRLRHLFKDETGISPMQYLKEQRMQKARELLQTTFLKVNEVMFKVGVKDESHFVRDFKKRFGLSPSQYRAQYLKTEGKIFNR
jgi:transcriptional regulator GlxA family with amidase domain